MVSGSDCHGAPVEFKAEEQGISPEQYAENSHNKIVETFGKLGFLYDNYTTTTTENHKEVVQNIFLVMKELGYLTTKKSEQYYDPKVNRFLPDRYVRGTCPECGNPEARGDECPQCGAYLEPSELTNHYSTLSDATPIIKETEHFYIRLDKLQPKLEPWVKANNGPWRKWVKAFTDGWLRQGLEARPVTRDTEYGIEIPVDGWKEGKSIYVWFEAVIGYLSAAIEWAKQQGNDSLWQEFWKNPEAKHFYFIAGGNVPFHTIIWPGELIGYNEKYDNPELKEKYPLPGETNDTPLSLPYDVPANKMLFFKGKKMSKGDDRGITVEHLIDTYSASLIRYFFTRYAPENNDREYTWKDFIEANNSELVGNIGNFINRTLTFTYKNFDKKVPEGSLDEDVSDAISHAFEEVGDHIEKTEFVKATEEILRLGDFANKYFNDKQPWVDVKEDKDAAAQTLYNCIQLVEALRTLIKPLTPTESDELAEILNLELPSDPNHELAQTGAVKTYENLWKFNEIPSGHEFNEPHILFEKLEYTKELKEMDKAEPEAKEKKPKRIVVTKGEEYDKWLENIRKDRDIYERIIFGQITNAQNHPNSRKLGMYKVNIGDKEVQVLAGDRDLNVDDIVAYIPPGTKIPTAQDITIQEKEIGGELSQGMFTSADEIGYGEDHNLVLTFDLDVEPGSKINELLD